MCWTRTFTTVAALLMSAPAPASVMDGNYLLQMCGSDNPACVGYVLGVADALRTEWEDADTSPRFCIPDGVSGVQMRDVVENYLQENPQSRHLSAAGLSAVALTKAFPCV